VRNGFRIAVAALAALLLLAGPAGAAFAPAPTNRVAPQLQGPSPPQDGLTLTAKPGQWDGPPGMTISREWVRCNTAGAACAVIPGATGTTYTLGAADSGSRVNVQETATCQITTPACRPQVAASAPTAPVLADPHNEGAPEISGVAQVGRVLSADVGFWRSPAPLSFSYQWIRCDRAGTCANIAGAARADYRLVAADRDAALRVVVTAHNSRPRSGTAVSKPTLPVGAAPVAKKTPRRAARLLSPFPRIVIAGLIARGSAQLTEFTIRGPRGALVRVRCRGRRCPFKSKRLVMRTSRVRVRSLERVWPAGPVLEVTVTKAGFIGKFSRFRFRASAAPRREDLCIAPGAKKPKRCPRGT
jgi:hypothetical protein